MLWVYGHCIFHSIGPMCGVNLELCVCKEVLVVKFSLCVYKCSLKPLLFVPSFLYSFLHSLIHSLVHLLIHLFIYSFIHSFIFLFIRSYRMVITAKHVKPTLYESAIFINLYRPTVLPMPILFGKKGFSLGI